MAKSKKKNKKKATTSQIGVNVVNQNTPFEAKVVFRRPNELHETSEFVDLFDQDTLLKFVELTKENCGISPVVINAQGRVLVGNARLIVAKTINIDFIPTVRQELLTSEEITGFSYIAMQVAYNWGLGPDFLAVELKELKAIGLNMKFLIQNGDEEDGFTTV